MKRVLILYSSSQVVCGIGNWIETFCRVMRPKGWEIVVALTRGRRFHDPVAIEAAHPDWKTIWMDGRTGTEEGRVQSVETAIRREHPDVVLVKNLHSSFEGARRARRAGVSFKFVAANHGSFPHHAAAIVENSDVVDAAVCVNQLACMAMAASDRIDRARVYHAPNAVARPFKPASWPRARENPGMIFGYAARLCVGKRSQDLIPWFNKISTKVPDIRLWIAGSGEAETLLRAALSDDPRVRFLGRLSRDELYHQFYPFVDVGLSFSPSEGWPLAIAEIMIHGGVPLVADYHGCRQEKLLVHLQNACIFPVGNHDEAVGQAVALCSEALREKMGREAIQTMDAFTPEVFADRWDGLLEHMMSLPALPPPKIHREVIHSAGLSERKIEFMRRVLHRYVPHESPRSEWPEYQVVSQVLHRSFAEAMGQCGDVF